jgi:hypothetical protein
MANFMVANISQYFDELQRSALKPEHLLGNRSNKVV